MIRETVYNIQYKFIVFMCISIIYFSLNTSYETQTSSIWSYILYIYMHTPMFLGRRTSSLALIPGTYARHREAKPHMPPVFPASLLFSHVCHLVSDSTKNLKWDPCSCMPIYPSPKGKILCTPEAIIIFMSIGTLLRMLEDLCEGI